MYSPKIKEQHIPVLYQLGKQIKKPMTHLVDEAIAEYIVAKGSMLDRNVVFEERLDVTFNV